MDRHSEIEEIASLFSERLREAEQRTLAARQVMLDAIQTRLDPPPSNGAVATDTTLPRTVTSPAPTSPAPTSSGTGRTGTWRTPRDVDLRWASNSVVDVKTAHESSAQWSHPADESVPSASRQRQSAVLSDDEARRSEVRHGGDGSDRAFLWAVPLAGLVALATVSLLLLLL